MSATVFTKIRQVKAVEISAMFELGDQGRALLSDEIASGDFIYLLLEHEDYDDAVKFLAYALPKREATWWACLCARSCLTEQSKTSDIKAIEFAETWVYRPTAANAKINLKIAEATAYKTAAGWAAMAAFWSGENISPIKGNIVIPAPELTAKAVIGAVKLAAVQAGSGHINKNYQLFIRQGIDIACGGDGRKVTTSKSK